MSPREPLVGGAATGSSRVPIRYQFQTTECGVATLASILAYFGHDLSMERVRELTGVSRDCVTAADLLHAGRELGFECKARRCEPDDLAALGLPLIVHLNFIHFVVVEEITDDVVRVMDPSGGPHEILRERFDDSFTGIALSFRPPAPSSAADPPSVLQGLWQRLAHFLGRAGIQALGATAAMHVAASIAVAAAISRLAAGAFPVATGLLGLALTLEFVANRRLASLGRTTVRRWQERLLRGVMAQGPFFFAYRIPGPLRDAMVQPERTARQLCTALIPACFSLATLPVWVLAAFWIHPVAGGMLASALTVGLGFVVWRVRHPDGRYGTGHTDSRSAEAALAVQLMQIESWRTGVRPRDFALAAIDADAWAQAERQRRLELLLPLPAYRWLPLPCLLFTLAGIALLQPLTWVDLLALALLALAMGRALEPAAALPDELMALEKDLVQLEDFEDSTGLPVAGAQSPESSNEPPLANGAVLAARDLSFAHAPRQPLVFEGLEVELFAGEQLGITGPSGGGKSTLARLLAGIEQPRTGSVRIAPEVLPVGWLEKSPILFQASVRENLCLGRQDLDDERLWQALADACLDDVMAGRPGGLDALLHPGGRSLSGGQEQRLELAQALLHGAQLLVIDEALDGLNPTLEITLRKRLRRRGCTLVVVSHRAATLARCDRVLRLNGGALLPVDPASFTE
ncbi:MAG: ATP-binding cassette domain-containing protein, partial [Gammaproteobacteria bacterium]|nr:ATP-binding cassette domain-containing protein [Gammaproteobacteria bacterium]